MKVKCRKTILNSDLLAFWTTQAVFKLELLQFSSKKDGLSKIKIRFSG